MVAMVTALGSVGACSSGGSRVYDPYYNDYHPWGRGEERFYRQWESETHRSHVAFDRRSPDEQHVYFDWRHTH